MVIGTGVRGVAVTIQIIEKAKQGKQIRSITLIEKGKSVGPGLAYSQACSSTILNMHADTIGLYTDEPKNFSQWMKSRYPGLDVKPFPTRYLYGTYLAELMDNAAEEAKRLGIIL